MRVWSASTIVLVLAAASVALAAPPPGEVTGVVRDAFARPLPAARIRLETADGRVVDRATADGQGRFVFTGVAPGAYGVVAEGEGFEPSTARVVVSDTEGAQVELELALPTLQGVRVTAQRLEEERIKVQPRIGASTYEIGS
jgi:carboxypeptidase family protein